MRKPISTLASEYLLAGRAPDGLLIDAHGHWGAIPGAYLPVAGEAHMISALRTSNVERIICSDMEALFLSPDDGNERLREAIARHPDLLSGYWAVNPRFPQSLRRAVRDMSGAQGFVGLKILPDYHTTPLTDDAYTPVLEDADALALPILVHTWGGSAFNDPQHIECAAKRYPRASFIMGHSGYGAWERAIHLAKDYPNVYLELTAVYVAHDFSVLPAGSGTPHALPSCLFTAGIIEHMVEVTGSQKILFGTDMPWYNIDYAAGAVLFADIDEVDQRNILGDNARRLLLGAH